MSEITDEMLEALTVQKAAELLDVSERTIWRYVKRGEIPSFKIGRAVRIRREKLFEFIREQERGAESDA